jgi:hypothetical protein
MTANPEVILSVVRARLWAAGLRHCSRCGKCGMRRAPGVLFGVFGVCLGPKLVLFMRKD